MVQIGKMNTLIVLRKVEIGVYLDDGDNGILLPRRFEPPNVQIDDKINVFIYQDKEGRNIATTQQPLAQVGDIKMLQVLSNTSFGSFVDIGIMKDLFVPMANQIDDMQVGKKYLLKIDIDPKSNRIIGTQYIDKYLNNNDIQLAEKDVVDLIVYRKTDIGYAMIINNTHLGLLYHTDIFSPIQIGDELKGYIKTIREDNKIDVQIGKMGYAKIEDESEKILRLLNENNGAINMNDKTAPELIYQKFGISKKVFKSTIGNLYKERKIIITPKGIELTPTKN